MVVAHHGSSHGVETAFAIESRGLSVMQGRSVRLIPWNRLRFLQLHVTSGVGTTGFPVYSARIRTRFVSREISSLDWQGEKGVDRSADYVRFMEALIPFAAERNPHLRLRRGGDPLLEASIPMVLSLLVLPLLFIPLFALKVPLGFLAVLGKKSGAKIAPWLLSLGFGAALNAFPWSSGTRFEANDVPVAELPPRYRDGGVGTTDGPARPAGIGWSDPSRGPPGQG
nr:hypothetical protein [Aureimonas jatrophae]